MKTIECKYIGPTNTKPSRIRATDGDNTLFLSIDGRWGFEDNCELAVDRFCRKLGWTGELIGGHTKDGMVFCFIDTTYHVTVS
jgi:hypothetical protein